MKKRLVSLYCLVMLLCTYSVAMAAKNPLWPEHEEALRKITQQFIDRNIKMGPMEYEIVEDAETGEPVVYWPLIQDSTAIVRYDTGHDFHIRFSINAEKYDQRAVDLVFKDFLFFFTGRTWEQAESTLAELQQHTMDVQNGIAGTNNYLLQYKGYKLGYCLNLVNDKPRVELWYVGD